MDVKAIEKLRERVRTQYLIQCQQCDAVMRGNFPNAMLCASEAHDGGWRSADGLILCSLCAAGTS